MAHPGYPNQGSVPHERQAGTIIVDTGSKHLYYVLPNNEAIEYRIATGAEAYGWSGRATVGQMKEWPTWMPTGLHHGALAGVPRIYRAWAARGRRWDNPLGARALYLFQGNHDTLYRAARGSLSHHHRRSDMHPAETIASISRMRMHPDDTAWPIPDRSSVPWMR